MLGTSAFSGAINIVTRNADSRKPTAWVELSGGSFGTMGAEGGGSIGAGPTTHMASGGYTRSDGGTLHSDFEKSRMYYRGRLAGSTANLDWQLGASRQSYGANTFYSAKFDNQYERTSHIVASVGSDVHGLLPGLSIRPTLYYNRFNDHYQLRRGKGGAENGENYHLLNIYGVGTDIAYRWAGGTTTAGFDLRHEHILSTAYGNPLEEDRQKDIRGSERRYNREASRTNNSIFVEHSIVAGGLTVSAGMLANRNTGLDSRWRLYPGVDASFRPDEHWKLFASWNMALRMPTYTDLYALNAAQQGDPNLKPERNNMLKTGARFRTKGIEITASAFYSHGRDMIDWVYETTESTRYHALNIGKLDNMGFSVDIDGSIHSTFFPLGTRMGAINYKLGYAFIHQHHETDAQIYKSLYALEYLRHKVVAEVEVPIWSRLSTSWGLRWQQRMNGYHPYTKIDAKLLWKASHYKIYVQADNLTAHRYYDLGGVPQPGLWLMAGIGIHL